MVNALKLPKTIEDVVVSLGYTNNAHQIIQLRQRIATHLDTAFDNGYDRGWVDAMNKACGRPVVGKEGYQDEGEDCAT